ncbi:MAG: FAD-dependent oxidoreductase [Pseudomonadota bacterium]
MAKSYDIAVIGAGIAGASAAAEMAAEARVLLLEMEAQPGYHTTGRSAALFSKTYGPKPIRALSRASEAFYLDPPEGFSDTPLLQPRGTLFLVRPDQGEAAEAFVRDLGPGAAISRIPPPRAAELLPLLRPEYLAEAICDDEAQDIDVDALHQGYLRRFRALGGTLTCDAGLTALAPDGAGWRLTTRVGEIRAAAVVNAAGAWADQVAVLAGLAPAPITPKRRTALIVAAPEGIDPSPWRMAVDVEERFYLKPEAGKLLISPADETPSEPCDAQPEELDIALCVDRIERAFDLSVRRIEHKWAGLRSFARDKCPVIGFDPRAPGFFWLAGQGGYGIQSAPAAGRVAAALALGRDLPADVVDQGLETATISPARLAGRG